MIALLHYFPTSWGVVEQFDTFLILDSDSSLFLFLKWCKIIILSHKFHDGMWFGMSLFNLLYWQLLCRVTNFFQCAWGYYCFKTKDLMTQELPGFRQIRTLRHFTDEPSQFTTSWISVVWNALSLLNDYLLFLLISFIFSKYNIF